MRLAQLRGVAIAVLAAMSAAPAFAQQGPRTSEIKAGAPVDVSVTVYRDPDRDEGGFELDELGGFALITETRRVVLPPGEHKLRFEGVADGIEAVSAIVTGLPSGVIEKNRDAMLLSPSALVASAQAQGGRVQMVRTNPKTGVTERVQGTIRTADASSGVVFETANGVEALRCSGLPETFDFDAATTGLVAVPTLSVLTRVEKQTEAVVQLSYLSRGFDWAADYTGDMRAANKMDVGAWITLANGNSVGFPNARVQIVAGRLNRESGEVEPIQLGQPILAQCWPQGSTSDPVPPITIERAFPLGFDPSRFPYPMPAPMAAMAPGRSAKEMSDVVIVTGAKRVEQEELGDLKLYRVPDRVTVASRQSKQVRLIDKPGVPVTKIYEADFYSGSRMDEPEPMTVLLRTKNDVKNGLGVPLPSGRVSVFETVGRGAAAQRMLSAEADLRDLAVNEEVELDLFESPDVQVQLIEESYDVQDRRRPPLPFLPGMNLKDGATVNETFRVEITNARPVAIQAEVRLEVEEGDRLVKADRPVGQKNGRPIFRVTVPANSSLEIRYQTATPP
jgi:hypothetical protein